MISILTGVLVAPFEMNDFPLCAGDRKKRKTNISARKAGGFKCRLHLNKLAL